MNDGNDKGTAIVLTLPHPPQRSKPHLAFLGQCPQPAASDKRMQAGAVLWRSGSSGGVEGEQGRRGVRRDAVT